jgi:hypothetical protein
MRTIAALLALSCLSACSSPDGGRRGTIAPTYDKTTGKLKELASDANANGIIDTWTEMDGARPILTRMDRNEDGRADRWEYYDGTGQLEKVGYSRGDDGRPDAWAFAGADGTIARIEMSSRGDPARPDRREYYEAGVLARAEEDGNADGAADKWETYDKGAVKTASFDEDADGRADRRLTYEDGELVLIETEPDGRGGFRKRTVAG